MKNKKVVFEKRAVSAEYDFEKKRRLHLVLLGVLCVGIGLFAGMENEGGFLQGSVLSDLGGGGEAVVCSGVEMPIVFATQGERVPDEILAEFTYAPEVVELEYFQGGNTWSVVNLTEEEGKVAVRMVPVGDEVVREFGSVQVKVNADNVVQLYLREKVGEEILEMRTSEFITVSECE